MCVSHKYLFGGLCNVSGKYFLKEIWWTVEKMSISSRIKAADKFDLFGVVVIPLVQFKAYCTVSMIYMIPDHL